MAAKQFHLWRRYPTAPYRRWACTVEPADTDAGFKIVDSDRVVADAGFLHTLSDHMGRPRPCAERTEDEAMVYVMVEPGSDSYFAEAIRSVPHTALRSVGRV